MSLGFYKRRIFFITGLALFFVIAVILPVPVGLEQSAQAYGYNGKAAMVVLGSLVWAICWWAGMVIPDWCTALGMQCIWIVAGELSFSVVFASFSESTVWLIVGAFCLGTAITKTGLLTRISLFLMRLFPTTFRGQVIAMMTVGTVCGPLMPSTTAKVVLGSKLVSSCADLIQYENDSKELSGLFLASWTGFDLTAPMFLSASFLSYSLVASLPQGYSDISWTQWFLAMSPWGGLIFLGMYCVIIKFYHPQMHTVHSKDSIKEKGTSLGKIGRQEKIMAIIVGLCLIFWILEKQTGISAGLVALIGGIFCFGLGLLRDKEISSCVPWGFVIMMGAQVNMGNIFIKTGISDWLLSLVGPLISNISNPILIILFVYIISVLMRFILASQTAAITLLTSLFSPIAISVNIHPLITGFIVYTAVPCWIMLYQNPTYIAALEAMDGTIHHNSTKKAAIAYLLFALLINLISIPYWTLLGYFS